MAQDNFKLYENMAELNIDKFAEIAKSTDWPKGKRYTVNCGKTEFKVQTYFGKGSVPECGYDAYSAIETIYVRQLSEKEIHWEHEGPQYADPAFNRAELEYLDENEVERRIKFIRAVSNLINNQATMEAISTAAVKKKNGTLYKNRVLKIASSGIANGYRSVYAIVARAKTDTSLSITFEEQMCSEPQDNEVWANDFISTIHEGLPITEALKAINAKL